MIENGHGLTEHGHSRKIFRLLHYAIIIIIT